MWKCSSRDKLIVFLLLLLSFVMNSFFLVPPFIFHDKLIVFVPHFILRAPNKVKEYLFPAVFSNERFPVAAPWGSTPQTDVVERASPSPATAPRDLQALPRRFVGHRVAASFLEPSCVDGRHNLLRIPAASPNCKSRHLAGLPATFRAVIARFVWALSWERTDGSADTWAAAATAYRR